MTTHETEAQLEAEVTCQRCRLPKWVPFASRHSGQKQLPAGVEFDRLIRCQFCSSDHDYTVWTGRMRWKTDTY